MEGEKSSKWREDEGVEAIDIAFLPVIPSSHGWTDRFSTLYLPRMNQFLSINYE